MITPSECPGCKRPFPDALWADIEGDSAEARCKPCDKTFDVTRTGSAPPYSPPPPTPTPHPGAVARDEAIERVEEHAKSSWIAEATRSVMDLARKGREFTTDDVWKALRSTGVTTPEPRAMGAVMRRLAKSGVIRNTRRTVESDRPECHRRPVTVWEPITRGTTS